MVHIGNLACETVTKAALRMVATSLECACIDCQFCVTMGCNADILILCFCTALLEITVVEFMTIESEIMAAVAAMDDRSKLRILRTAQGEAVRCPAPVMKLRLASSDLCRWPLLGSLCRAEKVVLRIVGTLPKNIEKV
jgi:hypothetical protein